MLSNKIVYQWIFKRISIFLLTSICIKNLRQSLWKLPSKISSNPMISLKIKLRNIYYKNWMNEWMKNKSNLGLAIFFHHCSNSVGRKKIIQLYNLYQIVINPDTNSIKIRTSMFWGCTICWKYFKTCLPMGILYLISIIYHIHINKGLVLVCLFNSISTSYGLFNAKIWFIRTCLIIIICLHTWFQVTNPMIIICLNSVT